MRTEHRGSTDPGNRHGAVEGGVGPSPPSHCDQPPAPSWRSLLCYTWTRQKKNTGLSVHEQKTHASNDLSKRTEHIHSCDWVTEKKNLKGSMLALSLHWQWALFSYFLRRTLVMCYHIFLVQRGCDDSTAPSDHLFSICLIIAEGHALRFQSYIIRGNDKNCVLSWEIKLNWVKLQCFKKTACNSSLGDWLDFDWI